MDNFEKGINRSLNTGSFIAPNLSEKRDVKQALAKKDFPALNRKGSGALDKYIKMNQADAKVQNQAAKKKIILEKYYRADLNEKFSTFTQAELGPEDMKRAIRFASSSIWDILKKARKEGEDDDEIADYLLATLMRIYSNHTFEHSTRVMEWTMELGEEIGIKDKEYLKNLGKAAFFKDIGMIGFSIGADTQENKELFGDFLSDYKVVLKGCGSLHDIGKTRIPSDIINKAGPLTGEEFNIIKIHPVIGAEIVKPYPALHKAIPGILHHHEKYNGTGYPSGVAGQKIPLSARIITITDSFDAMTEDRPYRKGLSYTEALNELIHLAGIQFDPDLVIPFIKMVSRKYEINLEELDIDPDLI